MVSGFLSADFLLNHLWQSTVFTAVAALLTLFFRKNHARVRYALWLAASIKFLVPFSLFIAIGSSIDVGPQQSASITSPAFTIVESISRPFDAEDPLQAIPVVAKPDWSHFIRMPAIAMWLVGCLVFLAFYLAKGRRIRALVRKALPITKGRAFEALQRLEQTFGRRFLIRLASSNSSMEPGVFGIFRPIVLLPSGMPERLSDSELEAILAHELAHIRRRDNLMSSVHMLIEALFWFLPMVWWIGTKLVQERERACDEEVLRLGKDPQAYAEGILKVCEFYLESPLACVAGVTGSDMKKRIHSIMCQHIGSKVGWIKKLFLAGAGIAVLAVPIIIGLMNAPLIKAQSQKPIETKRPISETPPVSKLPAAPAADAGRIEAADPKPSFEVASISQAQTQAGSKPSFEVVSIKEAADCGNVAPGVKVKIPGGTTYDPGGRYTTCNLLSLIIRDAYQMELFSSLSGVPGWSADILYKIEAKAEGNPDKEQMRLMVQSLLEDRFKLKMHRETRETPAYSLIVAKGGHKLQPAKDEQGNPIVSLPSPEERKKKGMDNMAAGRSRPLFGIISSMAPGSYGIVGGRQAEQFTGKAISMESFATALYSIAGRRMVIDKTGLTGRRKVIDKTGLTGLYDIQMNYAPPGPPGAADPALSTEPSAPTIFNALQEQLGLKLESEKAPLDYYIIDSAEKPSGN